MNRRGLSWFMTALILCVLAGALPALAQEKAQPPAKPATQPATQATPEPDTSTVEKILRQQEESLTGEHFTYDPEGRRDPFRSLFEVMHGQKTGERPPGIQGMLVTEIDLAGIVEDPRGDMGLLMGSDNKGYFLRVGDSVYDGTVISIDPRLGTMTFRQQIDDPRRIKPYRDVVKRLEPMDDEESR